MGTFAANNITTWFSGYDMTGDLNSTVMNMEYDALDTTVYGCSARTRIAGLEDVTLQEAGYWQAGSNTIDPTAFTALGSASQVITNAFDPAETNPAYIYRAREFQYQTFGQIDEVMPFSLQASSSRPSSGVAAVGAVRGRILKTKASVAATGATGTAFQLGATGASQFLYAAFHVFSAGTTITAVVESNADNTFGSPTTRFTFGPITTTGGTWGTRVAGAITDQWYRLRVTAITGTFSIACVAGIK